MADIFAAVDWQTMTDEPCAYCGVMIPKGTSIHVLMEVIPPVSVHKSCWAIEGSRILRSIAFGLPFHRSLKTAPKPVAAPSPNQLELLTDGKVG